MEQGTQGKSKKCTSIIYIDTMQYIEGCQRGMDIDKIS